VTELVTVNILFNITESLSTIVFILQHENQGLRNILKLQKKKGKKDIYHNLYRKKRNDLEDYSLSTVVVVRQYHETKMVNEATEA